eukprot:c27453_g5_i2 orf=89-766(+)
MRSMVQGWFTGGPGSAAADPGVRQEPDSLLANWNSYAAARTQEGSTSSKLSLDLEAAVPESIAPFLKSANETILGAFSSVSKGVRELPGNVQTAASTMPSRKAILYFTVMMASGIFFLFISIAMFLPVMVVMPQKFAICFTMGCLFIIGSFFALKGPKTQLFHMVSKERLPFTAAFLASMAATIYVSMVQRSYILSVIFSAVQVFALLYYVVSYFPGGSAELEAL